MQSKWKLFGHILGLEKATPAYIYMASYLKKPEKEVKGFRGRPRMTLPYRIRGPAEDEGGHSSSIRGPVTLSKSIPM